MKKAYKFGIELETVVSNDNGDDLYRVVAEKNLPYGFKSDGSIEAGNDGRGREIYSNEILGYTKLDRSIKAMSKIMRHYEVKVNNSCGFHVHISNKRFFNATNIKRIVHVWASLEDVLMTTQPKSRFNNGYCQRLLRDFIMRDQDLPRAKEALVNELGHRDRYFTLNLRALEDHGTIECRLHSGTTDSIKIMAWVDLLLAIYDYALLSYNKNEVNELFNMSISDEKIEKVFSMLKLTDKLKAHFRARIYRFGFETLKRQQASAVEALKVRPTISRLRKAYEKASQQFSRAQETVQAQMRVFDQRGW